MCTVQCTLKNERIIILLFYTTRKSRQIRKSYIDYILNRLSRKKIKLLTLLLYISEIIKTLHIARFKSRYSLPIYIKKVIIIFDLVQKIKIKTSLFE